MPREATTDALRVDLAVVGAGAAGLYTALVAARSGARVALVSNSPLAESASYWAQGGIAAALAIDDSSERHLADTLAAGRGCARESAARVLCEESPDRVRELQELGVRFDADRRGALKLGLEGGHSTRRVVHAGGSATGRRITRQLSAVVATSTGIELLERASAHALWVVDGRCVGVATRRGASDAVAVLARATVLATGGAAALWARTTNPRGAVGTGLTLAHFAGAALADLELVQFHPTALALPGRPELAPGECGARDGFLITEAVRGEGALLVNGRGERFVDELAHRDEVAVAVQAQLDSGAGPVRLDMREIPSGRFPNISSALAAVGIDVRSDLVPVAPAAHYTMGGIAVDLEGRSTVPGLYAVGECAASGLHGANRLASNSLADCFVFGRRAGLAAIEDAPPPVEAGTPPSAGPSPLPSSSTRDALWRLAGLGRSAAGLDELTRDPFPLVRFVAASGLAREESRGAHRRTDRPATDPALDAMHAVVGGDERVTFERWH